MMANNPSDSSTLSKTQARLTSALGRDFAHYPDPISYIRTLDAPAYRVDIDTWAPAPGLLYALLTIGFRFPDFGRFEKLLWEIPFVFHGKRCGLALQKFGLRFYVDRRDASPEDADPLAYKVVARLAKGLQIFERDLLEGFAAEQVQNANVTIANQYWRLRSSYDYFRGKAEALERDSGPDSPLPGDGSLLEDTLNLEFRRRNELFDNAVAAVNAYLSLLEHILVFVLPFAGFDAAKESLTGFIGDRWRDKFKRVFDIGSDHEAKRHYDALTDTAEEYRNPYSHGGFEKGHGSLYVHVPGVGALPARLSKARIAPHLGSLFGEVSVDSIWRLFDDVDAWLRSGPARYAVRHAESGLDLAFDRATIGAILAATESEKVFDEYLGARSYEADAMSNMDW